MSMGGLPPVDPAALPREVRAAGPERRQEYAAALSFERQLVAELTKTLERTTGSAASTGRDLVPGALADAVMAAGGLGLAATLDRAGRAQRGQA